MTSAWRNSGASCSGCHCASLAITQPLPGLWRAYTLYSPVPQRMPSYSAFTAPPEPRATTMKRTMPSLPIATEAGTTPKRSVVPGMSSGTSALGAECARRRGFDFAPVGIHGDQLRVRERSDEQRRARKGAVKAHACFPSG